MKNKLADLNNHLFAQLERLSDEDLEGEKLKQEMARSKALSEIAKDIVSNGRLVLEAQKSIWEWQVERDVIPKMLQNT